MYTRIKILLGLRLSGHNDNLTEASHVKDEFYKEVEIQTEQQNRNRLNTFKRVSFKRGAT